MAVDIAPVHLEIAQVHRFTLDEYHQMIESGGFEDGLRVELIEGVICDMSPKTKEHEQAIMWLTRWLFANVDLERFDIGVQLALTLESSEPEPDLAVMPRDGPRPYHPGTAALVIEVAVSSQRRDLRQKRRLYAGAGVAEYWVIDVDGRRAVIHRGPGESGYASVSELPADGTLTAEALELAPLPLTELFAYALR